ncbi:EAL domain-containing protein [Umezawaea tangerina]|uniref:PAS domain S-box-containing protein/diguanylate cyclase (GGDEF)-like protein n=1 Tax=Umezawaea tangerina TaxID=84725 RepID=A0A2T0T7C6_9PSEU|nr:EAL domain-containing protein [Umezawaea tangerina]PRY41522.1 PAS domain S-box-containing protein/diguanylate cyclase (GGDEF)-like protein [Umezawaea tangerina]
MHDNTRLPGAPGQGMTGTGTTDDSALAGAVQAHFAHSSLGFAVIDAPGAMREVNGALCDLVGLPADTLIGVHIGEVFTTDADLSANRLHADAQLTRPDGDTTAVVLDVAPLSPDLRTVVVINSEETSVLRAALIRQSLNDLVTGLPNRTQLLRWLDRCPDVLGLVTVDVDGFHVVNEALGHDAGDHLLKSVAARLVEVCAPHGRVARTGHDEFTLVVDSPDDVLGLIRIVEDVDASLAEPVYVDGVGVGVTVSTGISVQRTSGRTAADLLRTAEVAARWSRQDGRARWTLYDPQRDTLERRQFTMASSIAGALENGEIDTRYTPVHSLPHRRVVALEASAHWAHPEHGPLSQDAILNLAESTGNAIRLGRVVLADACAQAGRWLAEFGDTTPLVAVRLTSHQCREPELVAVVRHLLADAALPADRLRLIVEDDVLLSLTPEQVEELDILTGDGVSVLRHQREGGRFDAFAATGVPISGHRVDGTVVRGLDDTAPPLVRSAVVGMLSWAVRNLDGDLFAQDVRTETEARELTRLGVAAAQGPHFGAPLTPGGVRDLLRGT